MGGAPTHDPLLGQRVSNYQIVEKLGVGGMGAVYKAIDLKLDRLAALKFLLPRRAAADDKIRFLREARAASTLDHVNIGTIYGVEEMDDERIFIIMAYYEGETLLQRIRRGSLPTAQAIDISAQIALGLAHAHSKGIVHRDIKPSNVLLTSQNLVKIVDFGLAKLAGGENLTQTGAAVGTAAYMSPEQALGLAVDGRTDVWSLGVVLYQMLTGELPFRGETSHSTLYNIVHEPPLPVTGATPELEHVLSRSLEKDPEQRYQNALELHADLMALDHSPGATTATMIRQGPAAAQVPWVTPRPPVASRGRGARSLRVTIAAATMVLGLVVAAILLLPLRDRLGRWTGAARVEKHIAVLPFDNVGNDPGNQALCDGLLETLTSRLSNLKSSNGSMWVVPAAEVRQRKVADAAGARREFGATLVVTGSVQRGSKGIRLTVDLVDAANPRQLGSAVVDAPAGDLVALQDTAVARLARLMDVEFPQSSLKEPTAAPAAYELYLKGLGYVQRFDKPGNLDRAIQAFQDALRTDSRFALADSGLAEAYRRRYEATRDPADLPRATDYCNRALALDPQLASPYVTLGRIHSAGGQQELALQEFQHAMDLDPQNAEALQGLARAYETAGRLQEAEDLLKKAAALQPDYWESFNRLGSFYYSQRRYEDAIVQFRRVLQLTPDNIAGYSNLSTTYRQLERLPEAQSLLEKAIKLGPNYAVYSNLGVIYLDEDKYPDAVGLISKALQLNDRDYRLWGNLALAEALSGSLPKAREAFERAASLAEQAVKTQPGDAILEANLARFYAWLERPADALLRINAALARAPDDRQVLERAAEAYLHLGMRPQAVDLLNRALQHGLTLDQLQQNHELTAISKDPGLKLK